VTAISKALLAAVGIAVLLAGCGSSPPVQFFTLSAEPVPAAAASTSAGTYAVVVGPVTVPELVDRPQLVLRSSSSRVELAELARWGAPLKSEIPRVVADHLSTLMPDARVATSQQRASTTPDYRVLIDIQRFDTSPGEGASIHALWTVRTLTGTAVSGRSTVTEPAGEGYDALVAAHSRALAQLSRDIAAAITASRSGK
jgi:uncharacterized lipoprotein YmbA